MEILGELVLEILPVAFARVAHAQTGGVVVQPALDAGLDARLLLGELFRARRHALRAGKIFGDLLAAQHGAGIAQFEREALA